MKQTFPAALLALAVSAAVILPARAAEFDGNWSLTIITDKGSCDRGYRYALVSSGGKINYFGDADVEFGGTVSPAGDIKARFIKGTLIGDVTGKLSAGSGSWSGKSGVGPCSGHWQAVRS
jgi:hypothetical protein